MKISRIQTYRVQIPFAFSIAHNLKDRSCTESIILAIHSEDGNIGYGEGTPRDYVTGESPNEVMEKFHKALLRNPIPEIQDLKDLLSWENQWEGKMQMPSMVTALETALLDLLAQERACSIADFFPASSKPTPIYSAVFPYLPRDQLGRWLEKIKILKLPHVKMKVGHEHDTEHLALVREILGDEVDIRVDANRSWSLKEAREKIQSFQSYRISSIEEPLKETELEHLPILSHEVNVPIMLDESLCSLKDAQYYAARMLPDKLMFNLKLSKLGGLCKSSEIYHFARENGISCQLGCHVGETAILSAAGRLFAQCHELKYLEGSFAPYFMVDDISEVPLFFGRGGHAQKLDQPGLGIRILPHKIKKYSQKIAIAS